MFPTNRSSTFTGDQWTQPRGEVQTRRKNKVRIFFINFLAVDENGKYHIPVQACDGRTYNVPPIGDYIEVDELVADDLNARTTIFHVDPATGEGRQFDGFTTNPSIAEAVRAAFDSGKLRPGERKDVPDFSNILRSGYVQSLSDEELEKELEARKNRNSKK